ncbi:hypothetical protein [Chamaesiphon minutus]|uniref:Secreted protein n=1 Tax=Chamaesiphon minutus (strain ATCC 27169 / PCC 6605) TaxID=1173020 RepID=K9UIK8_CHAP6|nr:hypothetical protein [Chamaesiphon minutus]AFY94493.1 hypothetical protein Cha6605_3503 [Chamaesiphon minutus PCC 6605]
MKFQRSLSLIIATNSVLAISLTSSLTTNVGTAQATPQSNAVECSPIKGVWYYQGKGIPVSYDERQNVITVNMSNFRRPTAKGRMLSANQIEVNFRDETTFRGTLDGAGKISWSNGTQWEANSFYGSWKYENKFGPKISRARANNDEMKIDMSKYGRPPALGNKIGSSQASFNFPDDAVHTATLVSPNCIKWSNSTTWTK